MIILCDIFSRVRPRVLDEKHFSYNSKEPLIVLEYTILYFHFLLWTENCTKRKKKKRETNGPSIWKVGMQVQSTAKRLPWVNIVYLQFMFSMERIREGKMTATFSTVE